MPEALPSPDKYDPPFSVQERASLYQQFIMSGAPPKPELVEDTPEEEAPTINQPTPRQQTKLQAPAYRLSTRAEHVLHTHTQTASDLLTWFSVMTSKPSRPLQINSNGFIVTVQVADVKPTEGNLVVTMSYETGVSFSLDTGAQIQLKWEENQEWTPCVYLNKFDVGTGFPFFFMVFLS